MQSQVLKESFFGIMVSPDGRFLRDGKEKKVVYATNILGKKATARLIIMIDSKKYYWQAARSSIQHLARRAFFETTPSPKCAICGYDKHVEVAHIKPVSGFSDEATMREINSFSNLIGLCPNHHWEFDNGLLKL